MLIEKVVLGADVDRVGVLPPLLVADSKLQELPAIYFYSIVIVFMATLLFHLYPISLVILLLVIAAIFIQVKRNPNKIVEFQLSEVNATAQAIFEEVSGKLNISGVVPVVTFASVVNKLAVVLIQKNRLVISSPTLAVLDKEEFRFTIASELLHVRNGDARSRIGKLLAAIILILLVSTISGTFTDSLPSDSMVGEFVTLLSLLFGFVAFVLVLYLYWISSISKVQEQKCLSQALELTRDFQSAKSAIILMQYDSSNPSSEEVSKLKKITIRRLEQQKVRAIELDLPI